MSKVAIVSVGYTEFGDFVPEHAPIFYEMCFRAAKNALDAVGLSRADIGVEASYDALDGRMISNMYTSTASGNYLRDDSRVSEDGTMALAYAWMKIMSGDAETAIVVGYGNREGDSASISNLVFDPLFYRPIALTYQTGLAMQAHRYAHLNDVTEDIAAEIVAKNRLAGTRNPRAHLKSKVRVEDVLASNFTTWPLRRLMLPPDTGGAVAIVLSSEVLARRLTETPIWITGLAWMCDGYYVGGKELGQLRALKEAASRAYKMAGIGNPLREIRLFELFDVTPYHEMMAYEALGIAEEGSAKRVVKEKLTDPFEGGVPVNASGGTVSTDPYPGTGLLKIAEAYHRMTEAKENFEKALVHGFSYLSGISAQTHCVIILGR